MTLAAPDNSEAMDSGQSGFTLVEVLVTLALIAMLSTIMVGAIGQLAQLSAASSKNDAQVEMDALVSYLEQTISGAQARPLMEHFSDRHIFLEGSNSGIKFVSIARLGTDLRGLRDISISVEGDTDRKTLLQETHPRRFSGSEDLAGSSVTLAGNLMAVTFEYRQKTGTGSWTDRWVAAGQLPAAIRVSISAIRLGVRVEVSRVIFLSATG